MSNYLAIATVTAALKELIQLKQIVKSLTKILKEEICWRAKFEPPKASQIFKKAETRDARLISRMGRLFSNFLSMPL